MQRTENDIKIKQRNAEIKALWRDLQKNIADETGQELH